MPTPLVPVPDPSWIERLNEISLAYKTDDLLATVKGPNYFDSLLPTGYVEGTIIKVDAGDGVAALMVTDILPHVVVENVDPLSTNIPNASLPYIAFRGEKWNDDPETAADNSEALEVADAFQVPVYVGPGKFYTTAQPLGRYFGEGIISCEVPGLDDPFDIPLGSVPVQVGTPITKLDWRRDLFPHHDLELADFEQYISTAIGPKAGAMFDPTTTSSMVAVGYEALGLATGRGGCTAVGYKALAVCVAPDDSTAIGAGAMAATTHSDRNTCVGAAAGKWAGCDNPALFNHNFFQADKGNGTNDFDDWTALDSDARDLVGPVGYPATPPNTENAYITTTLPEDDGDNQYNVYLGRDAGNHNIKGSDNTFIGAHCAHGWNVDRSTFIGSKCGTRALIASDCVGIGYGCLTSNTRGTFNTAGGVQSMENNVFGINNTAWGANTLQALTGIGNGIDRSMPDEAKDQSMNNVAVGFEALTALVYGTGNTAVGTSALVALVKNDDNTAVGNGALAALTRGSGNTVVGADALAALTGTTGTDEHTAVGRGALAAFIQGASNTAVGTGALVNLVTGGNNTAIGRFAGKNEIPPDVIPPPPPPLLTSRSNVTCVGYDSKASGDNQVNLGNAQTTTCIYGAPHIRSDLRDKIDVRDTALGLEFIEAVRPVEFRYDYRDAYVEEEGTVVSKDGSRAGTRFHQGVIAQELKETMDKLGVDFGGYQDHKVNGGGDVLTLGYDEFIAPLIKSVQELSAAQRAANERVAQLEQRLAALPPA